MNPLNQGFKESAVHAADICNCKNHRLDRIFGLNDFLNKGIRDDDDAPTIAVKALDFFCDEWDPSDEKCRVAIVAVGLFLNGYHAKRPLNFFPQQPLKDLVSILNGSPDEQAIRRWIDSNFG